MNILIDGNRCPKLADLGLVHIEECTVGGFTATGVRMNPRWSSPQRLDGEAKTMSDDVYSFGCVGYYVSYSVCLCLIF
jgi:serine/threonine protein kinase